MYGPGRRLILVAGATSCQGGGKVPLASRPAGAASDPRTTQASQDFLTGLTIHRVEKHLDKSLNLG